MDTCVERCAHKGVGLAIGTVPDIPAEYSVADLRHGKASNRFEAGVLEIILLVWPQ